ncbi:hypothetical protein IMZ48_37225 [Candidatus Bathyarchaeota archaeon]|nr:hypothetical protein [Candidatus Bathyarchaeota archaeon]
MSNVLAACPTQPANDGDTLLHSAPLPVAGSPDACSSAPQRLGPSPSPALRALLHHPSGGSW